MTPRVMLVLDLPRIGLADAAVGHPDVVVQIRDRAAHACDIVAAAQALVARGVRLVVNDRVDLALAARAEGVHLPEGGLPVVVARALLGPAAVIGVSTHVATDLEERTRGATWAVFGPVWPTPAKGTGVGVPTLAAAVQRCPCPVIAIGGIDATRAHEAIAAGAAGELDAILGAIG
jgi:thiamine-phosphate diphosphorylase